ncbi:MULTISPECIES: bacteriocin [unclassified Leuconostoc]|uniref:bacteriocin n=1 Tax=Leuconostoc TaxID=1243 RepID=UPI0019047870|nr:bacteriocin [Leuconostoc sp. S51]MBK0051454.1 bacteriocin [Leuconostoc sp. S50]
MDKSMLTLFNELNDTDLSSVSGGKKKGSWSDFFYNLDHNILPPYSVYWHG